MVAKPPVSPTHVECQKSRKALSSFWIWCQTIWFIENGKSMFLESNCKLVILMVINKPEIPMPPSVDMKIKILRKLNTFNFCALFL